MLREVKEYFVDPPGDIPSIHDCREAVKFAKENNCFVKMVWSVKYSGRYTKMIDGYVDAEEIYDSLPKVYGM